MSARNPTRSSISKNDIYLLKSTLNFISPSPSRTPPPPPLGDAGGDWPSKNSSSSFSATKPAAAMPALLRQRGHGAPAVPTLVRSRSYHEDMNRYGYSKSMSSSPAYGNTNKGKDDLHTLDFGERSSATTLVAEKELTSSSALIHSSGTQTTGSEGYTGIIVGDKNTSAGFFARMKDEGVVKYLPPQLDPVNITTIPRARTNPWKLLVYDLQLIFSNLLYIPQTIFARPTTTTTAEIFMGWRDRPQFASISDLFRHRLIQAYLFILETLFFIAVVPMFLFSPGAIFLVLLLVAGLAIRYVARMMHGVAYGACLVASNMDVKTTKSAQRFSEERWLFCGGVGVGCEEMQENIDCLSKKFGRAVVGVQDNSYGLLLDLLSSILQRCIGYTTPSIRITYDYIRASLTDPSVSKVVLIGHGQGGAVISMVVDLLLVGCGALGMNKLEIYTFGSSATYLSNPHHCRPDSSHPPIDYIKCIEHYINANDFFARIGIIYHTLALTQHENRFAGAIFLRMGASGGLCFARDYLEELFPASGVPENSSEAELDVGPIKGTEKGVKIQKLSKQRDGFLKTLVDIDETIVPGSAKLAVTGKMEAMKAGRKRSAVEAGFVGGYCYSDQVGIVLVGRAMVDTRGKTVRDLSRLCGYLGGASPVESVDERNGGQV